jgi:hypothetical protein
VTRQFVQRGLALAAVAWCVAVGIWLWVTPIPSDGVGSSAYVDSGGVVRQTTYRFADSRSFADISALGPVPLIIPVLLTGISAFAVWRRRVTPAVIATVVLLAFVVLGGFSIGPGYLPAVGALIWAVVALSDV